MKKICFVFSLFLMICQVGKSQTMIDTMALVNELSAIHDRDQKTRTGGDSAAFMRYIDSCNMVQVDRIIELVGEWPGKSLVGEKGNSAVFLVVQHASLEKQMKYFPMLQKSVEAGESRPSNMALMMDRMLMRQKKKQMYGSQVIMNKQTGKNEIHPIEDEAHVNERRAALGLQTMEEYAKYFGIDYVLPAK